MVPGEIIYKVNIFLVVRQCPEDLKRVEYLDKLTNMIAAKAKAEWENQVRGFESLQMENEKLQMRLKEKEKEFEKHKEWLSG